MSTYGWRSRIGIIKATYRPKNFRYWFDTAPEGVEILPAAVGYRKGERTGFMDGLDHAAQLAETLAENRCEIVSIQGAPPFLLRGRELEAEWRHDLEVKLGIPVVTAMQPHLWALEAMGIKRVLTLTYYGDELNGQLNAYLASGGVESVLPGGLDTGSHAEDLYSTPLMGLDKFSFDDFYGHAKRLYRELDEGVDAIYINGSGWDAGPAVPYLEQDLGIPVIWPQALYVWATYQLAGVENRREGFGHLMSRWPDLPSTVAEEAGK